jgi:hypothetical protein
VSTLLFESLGCTNDETLDVSGAHPTSVSDEYTPLTSRVIGSVNWVQLDQGANDSSYLISSEDRFRVAMVRQ